MESLQNTVRNEDVYYYYLYRVVTLTYSLLPTAKIDCSRVRSCMELWRKLAILDRLSSTLSEVCRIEFRFVRIASVVPRAREILNWLRKVSTKKESLLIMKDGSEVDSMMSNEMIWNEMINFTGQNKPIFSSEWKYYSRFPLFSMLFYLNVSDLFVFPFFPFLSFLSFDFCIYW